MKIETPNTQGAKEVIVSLLINIEIIDSKKLKIFNNAYKYFQYFFQKKK